MFYDRYIQLCAKKGISPSRAAEECKINKANVSAWKNKGYTPRGAALNRLASYFEVTVDYLLTGEQKETPPAEAVGATFLDGEEQTLLELWRRATEEGQQAAMVLLRGYQRPDNNQKAPNGAASVG